MTTGAFEALLNVPAAIYRAQTAYNEVGEPETTYAFIATVPARLDRFRYAGSASTFAEQGIQDLPSHKLFCAVDVPMQPGDLVRVDGREYEVLEAWEPGGVQHHKEAWLKSV